ncbi:MAG: S1C family serine protease, partial [Planctomycetota bacterium]
MRTKQVTSWIVVLSVFLLAILLCIAWEKLTSGPVEPAGAQQVYDPKPVLAKISPSVVTLWAIKKSGLDTLMTIIGCGLIVDSHGLILTSATIAGNIESLYLIDRDDNKYQASIITADERTKLTLLKADTSGATKGWSFEPAELADPRRIRRGDTVYVLGGRRTPSSWELTTKAGKVTKVSQSLMIEKVRYCDLLQTNVPLASENAGGPIVNQEGKVVGLALPFVRPPNAAASWSYAVGADQSRHFMESLPIPHWSTGLGGQICSWLGADMLPISPVVAAGLSAPAPRGEVVNHIRNNSPAER